MMVTNCDWTIRGEHNWLHLYPWVRDRKSTRVEWVELLSPMKHEPCIHFCHHCGEHWSTSFVEHSKLRCYFETRVNTLFFNFYWSTNCEWILQFCYKKFTMQYYCTICELLRHCFLYNAVSGTQCSNGSTKTAQSWKASQEKISFFFL